MRFRQLQLRRIEELVLHAKLSMPPLGVAQLVILGGGTVEYLDPPRWPQQRLHIGFLREDLVLGHAMFDQGGVLARDGGMPRGFGIAPVRPEEWRERGQCFPMVMNIDGRIAGVVHQRADIAGQRVRIDTLALQQPRVAERGFESGMLAVHERDRAATLLQMNGDRYTHDARAQHDCVELHALSLSSTSSLFAAVMGGRASATPLSPPQKLPDVDHTRALPGLSE